MSTYVPAILFRRLSAPVVVGGRFSSGEGSAWLPLLSLLTSVATKKAAKPAARLWIASHGMMITSMLNCC